MLPGADLLVDDAPAVTGFPAPWRDLFRKSGRPLEAELARAGYALVPAAAARYRFADGSELVLPTDRGEQHEALVRGVRGRRRRALARPARRARTTSGRRCARSGWSRAFDRADLRRDVRRRLWSRRTVADLADRLGDPQLAAVVRSVALPAGLDARTHARRWPPRTSTVARTFGRWQVEPLPGGSGDAGRSSVLVELLAQRLALREVDGADRPRVDRATPRAGGGSPASARLGRRSHRRRASCSPSIRGRSARLSARSPPDPPRRLVPALGPRVGHARTDLAPAGVEETVALVDAKGCRS